MQYLKSKSTDLSSREQHQGWPPQSAALNEPDGYTRRIQEALTEHLRYSQVNQTLSAERTQGC